MNQPQKYIFTISLFGILLLFFLSMIIEPKEIDIVDIKEKNINQQVKIIGNVTKVNYFEKENFYVLAIQDSTGNISAIFSSIKLEINKSKNYIITGKIQEYNKTLQININKIENV